MKIHSLKSLPEYFHAVWQGAKTFEIRKNDRNFQSGDFVILQEYVHVDRPLYMAQFIHEDEWTYSGGIIIAKILHVSDYEQKEGYVVFGIEVIDQKFLLGDKPCETDSTFIDNRRSR